MKPIQTIETYTIDSKHYTLFGITYLLGGTLVLLFFAKKFHLPYLGVIGYIILFLSPLIFKKRFRKSFIKKTIIQFYSENFTIEQYNMNTNELESNDAYSFVQIISYKTYGSTKNDFSKLTLDMSDRTKIKYTFTEQANDGSETDVINIFRKQIHLYNEIKSNGKKIILKQIFLPQGLDGITLSG